MQLSEFSALTFDCYGTLINWERGMLDALGPWRQRTGVAADENALLTAYGRQETVVQTENPTMMAVPRCRGSRTRTYGR